LLDASGRAALTGSLFPLATLVTPNVPEAAALLSESVAVDEAALIQQGERLLAFRSQAILLKGGHRYASQGAAAGWEDEDAVDLLISRGPAGQPSIERIASKRVVGSSRGTGCALASGIAAGVAGGTPLDEACRDAKRYVLGMLAPAYYTGTTIPSD
jgi:hydroxymethylpyrimidine/phosphomethylpyrimidine kinase